jgi:hypothetical protein
MDWDEIPDTKEANEAWESVVDGILNKSPVAPVAPVAAPCLDPQLNVFIHQSGWRLLNEVKIGDWISDKSGWTRVTGRCERIVHSGIGQEGNRITDGLWILKNGLWKHPVAPIDNITWSGIQLITESGSFKIYLNSGEELLVRDFTEVGSENILESDARVEAILEN